MSVSRFDHVCPAEFRVRLVHLVGIKGTGMCALAELFHAWGVPVVGSDVAESFYTDEILGDLGIPVRSFAAESLGEASLVVHSAAYDERNPVIGAALVAGVPVLSYPEALGRLSAYFDSSAIAGVHGKTTTTALTGAILKARGCAATVLAGSAVSGFGNRSVWLGGSDFFVAETCEYRRHFLNFHPRRMVLTSIESDHQDFFPDYHSIFSAFCDFIGLLPVGGLLIYCADDPGAVQAARWAEKERPDVQSLPYGASVEGPWGVRFGESMAGGNFFRVNRFSEEFSLQVPGRHIALDAVASLALACALEPDVPGEDMARAARAAFEEFRGSRRRSERVGEARGIVFMDDYAHHPTAIRATLGGLKDFFPGRRLVVDFQAHTFSRTEALLDEFAVCFGDADVLLLQPVYASARESGGGHLSGEAFRDVVAAARPGKETWFCEDLEVAERRLKNVLRPGDLFVTMGAGNNRPLCLSLFKEFSA